MHAIGLLSQWLAQHNVIGHRARREALLKLVQALFSGTKLSLTHLGRHRAGDAYPKHHIKAADRLLGNVHLYRERQRIYRVMAQTVLAGIRRPVILVDWADTDPGQRWYLLKAAVAVRGRALSIYEKVYPLKDYNTPKSHREFLQTLKTILPEGCQPILVTDAGFRGPWFKAVEALGWDWVGRILGNIKYFREDTGRWQSTKALYAQATARVRHLGEVQLSRQCRYRFRLYLVRTHKPCAGQPSRHRLQGGSSRKGRRRHRAPWLLATSLRHESGSSRRIKQLYAQRMQIEEAFRDTKCHRWGFGLRYARCTKIQRLEVLLLIAALATLLLWLVGIYGCALDWVRRLQANTEVRKPVLSTVFVGAQLLRRPDVRLSKADFQTALSGLRGLVLRASLS
jgi:hypothetical protein